MYLKENLSFSAVYAMSSLNMLDKNSRIACPCQKYKVNGKSKFEAVVVEPVGEVA